MRLTRDSFDRWSAEFDRTPLDEIPPGEDESDLGLLGKTRFEATPADEIRRRVAEARNRGRSWATIAEFLGISEHSTIAAYGPGGAAS